MGVTSAAIHVLRPKGAEADALRAVVRSYESAGFTPSDDGDIEVAVARPGVSSFFSVWDSSNDGLEAGGLSDLAARLSRSLRTQVVLHAVFDSDRFEFVVFDGGAQVDAITSASTHPYAVLPGELREGLWRIWFGEACVEPLRTALQSQSPFADQYLADLLGAVGVDPLHASRTISDLVSAGASTARFSAPLPVPLSGDPPDLAWYHDDDDCREARVFPGAWPVPAGEAHSTRWLVVSSGGPVVDPVLRLRLEASGPGRVESIEVRAHTFHNGQVTTPNPVAQAACAGFDLSVGESDRSLDVPLTVPGVEPGSRRRYVIVIRARVLLAPGSDAVIRPRFGAGDVAVDLPPARLGGRAEGRRPLQRRLMEGELGPFEREAMLRLGEPSVLGVVAILPADFAVASMVDELCSALGAGEVSVHVERHMTASGSVSKSARVLGSVRERSVIKALTDPGVQTVVIGLIETGNSLPRAGVSISRTLRDGGPANRAETVHLAAFVTEDHPGEHDLLARFRELMESARPLQAWVDRSTWIPEFDLYDEYRETLYETATGIDWFRRGDRGALMSFEYVQRAVRWVAPEMWLGPALLRYLDRDTLETVASVEAVDDGVRMTGTVDDLEAVLRPILPGSADTD